MEASFEGGQSIRYVVAEIESDHKHDTLSCTVFQARSFHSLSCVPYGAQGRQQIGGSNDLSSFLCRHAAPTASLVLGSGSYLPGHLGAGGRQFSEQVPRELEAGGGDAHFVPRLGCPYLFWSSLLFQARIPKEEGVTVPAFASLAQSGAGLFRTYASNFIR